MRPDSVQRELHSLPFSEVLKAWDRLDLDGKDLPAIRWLCLNDRYYLLIKMLRRYDAWHPWVYARCREVEQAPDGHCDIWAREHFKSSIITIAGVIQEVLKNRNICIGIFSHTKSIAKGFLGHIQRELEGNENLKATFPDVLWRDPAKQSPTWSLDSGLTVKRGINSVESTIEAHGLVDGQPTSRHFDLLVYDDVVTRESVNTPEQISKTTEAWELSDNLGVAGGRRWIIGTRYHYADTYAEILKQGSAKARVYPATEDGTEDGKPVLFSPEVWAKKKQDQPHTVAAQLLCDPLAANQRMFDVSKLKTYEIRPRTLMAYIMCDPQRSNKPESDHTAIAVIGVDHGGNKYLLDGIDHHATLSERWRWIRDLWEKWVQEPGIMGVHVGYERFGAQSDLQYFEEQMRQEKQSFEIVELEWPRDGSKSKVDRVQRLTPDVERGRFYLPYPTDDNRLTSKQRETLSQGFVYLISQPIERLDENRKKYDLTERFKMQISMFPFGGKDDLIDAVSRIYDMSPVTPIIYDQDSLEPPVV